MRNALTGLLVLLVTSRAAAVDYDLRFTTVPGATSYRGFVRIPPTPWPTGVLLAEQPDPTPGLVHAPLTVVAPGGAALEFAVTASDGVQTSGLSNICAAVMVTSTATVTPTVTPSVTATPTRTPTASPTASPTMTRTATGTVTAPPPSQTATRTPMAPPVLLKCDYNGDGKVSWLEALRCRWGWG